MQKNLPDRLMKLACAALILAGLLFGGLFFSSGGSDFRLLFAALGCALLTGLYGVIRWLPRQ